jgi:di/tricarboxylate transporter
MWQMWVVLAGVVLAIVFYCWDRFPIEVVSASVVAVIMVFFHAFPLQTGNPTAGELLSGFANPALITILALLIVGHGIFQTGAMDGPTRWMLASYEQHPRTTLLAMFAFVFAVSAFINNTPVVVMFVPVLAAIAKRMEQSPSKLMIPLSYVCILAGMTTLIGSSTNLLVADSLFTATGNDLGFSHRPARDYSSQRSVCSTSSLSCPNCCQSEPPWKRPCAAAMAANISPSSR